MKINFFRLGVLFCSVIAPQLCADTPVTTKVAIGQGYRHDSLRWNMTAPHHKKYILSELDYTNLKVYLTTLKATVSNGTYIGVVDLAYGDILSGRERDSDYNRNNKRGEYLRTIGKIPGDCTIDASAKFGRIIPLFSDSTFTPSIGYGSFWQNLRVKRGYYEILRSTHLSKNQVRTRLDSTYRARWSAPFLDFRFVIPLRTRLTADIGYTFFYPLQYRGTAHWKLRHLHFNQKNRALQSYGHKGDITLRFACTDKVELALGCGLTRFNSKGGVEKGKPRHEHSYRQDFRRAERTCVDYLLSLSYAF